MNITLLKTVLRGLRYALLPKLIGQRIVIGSLQSIETDIKAVLGTDLPSDQPLANPESYEGELAKHNFITLTFSVPRTLLTDCPIVDSKTFRELGFVFSTEDKAAMLEGENWSMLDSIAEDVGQNNAIIKLFLEVEPPQTPSPTWRQRLELTIKKIFKVPEVPPATPKRILKLRLEENYFPKTFIVRDACLTNSDAIWLGKRFYL